MTANLSRFDRLHTLAGRLIQARNAATTNDRYWVLRDRLEAVARAIYMERTR